MTPREYLFSLEQFGIKLGLAQIRALRAALDEPDGAYPTIVIAGTNGKGSVTAMAERAFRAAGCRTGRYTSPHLVHIEERFAVDGVPITPETFDRLAARVRDAAEALPVPPSFFEATTALAMEAFREARVDVALFEVGLGGRLDATNVLPSKAVAITAIDFDHEAHLGTTIEAIAGEKAGVIKPDGLCVLGRNSDAARAVIAETCRSKHAELVYAPDAVQRRYTMDEGRTRLTLATPVRDYGTIALGLRGRHQVDNAITAVRLLETAPPRCGLDVPARAIAAGLEHVEWAGRLEVRRWAGREILLDGAHNPAGARALAEYLTEAFPRKHPIVLGVMRDKAVAGIVEALAPCASRFVCTAASSPRATPAAELSRIVTAIAHGVPCVDAATPDAALALAMDDDGPIVVAGSLYLVGDVRSLLS